MRSIRTGMKINTARAATAVGVLALLSGGAAWWATPERALADAVAAPVAGGPAATSYAEAVARVSPAVVTVRVEKRASANSDVNSRSGSRRTPRVARARVTCSNGASARRRPAPAPSSPSRRGSPRASMRRPPLPRSRLPLRPRPPYPNLPPRPRRLQRRPRPSTRSPPRGPRSCGRRSSHARPTPLPRSRRPRRPMPRAPWWGDWTASMSNPIRTAGPPCQVSARVRTRSPRPWGRASPPAGRRRSRSRRER